MAFHEDVAAEFRGALFEHVVNRNPVAGIMPSNMTGGEHFVNGTEVNANVTTKDVGTDVPLHGH